MPISSPVAGLADSKVSPETASTHSPPMKFLKSSLRSPRGESSDVGQAASGGRSTGTSPVRARRRSRIVALPPSSRPARRSGPRAGRRSPSRSGCPCSTRRACRRARLELPRDHAVDHPLIVRSVAVGARPAAMSGTTRPSSSTWAFHVRERRLELGELVPRARRAAPAGPHRARRGTGTRRSPRRR